MFKLTNHHLREIAHWVFFATLLMMPLALGCQRAAGTGGTTGLSPITTLPGQSWGTGPSFPSLGPLGSSARVPPPPTGSYGNAAFTGGINTTPASYAPSGVVPMSYESPIGGGSLQNSVVTAGGLSFAPTPSAHGNPPAHGNTSVQGNTWVETSANPFQQNNTVPNYAASDVAISGTAPSFGGPSSGDSFASGLRSGGMPVIDLTDAPAPRGYVAQPGSSNYAGQNGFQPSSPSQHSPVSTSAPISGGGYVQTPPAANQPAFSTADRPIQWQTPRR